MSGVGQCPLLGERVSSPDQHIANEMSGVGQCPAFIAPEPLDALIHFRGSEYGWNRDLIA